jgi:hypothetical protein
LTSTDPVIHKVIFELVSNFARGANPLGGFGYQFPLLGTGSIRDTGREENFNGGNEGLMGSRISGRRIEI